jgi:hypothetical protein
MIRISPALAALLTLALAACGGGSLEQVADRQAATARASTPAFTAATLFDWAPGAYPQFFSGTAADGEAAVEGHGSFTYRYWPATGNYLGVRAADSGVYVYGPVSNWQVMSVGALDSFRCQVVACGSAPTSYALLKESGLVPQVQRSSWDLARASFDVDGDGVLELFTAQMVYNPANSTPSTAAPSIFRFYRRQGDTLVEAPELLDAASVPGCIHPRKAVLADFNGDGRKDVFVACHGYDAMPFPGELNRIVLSQPNGSYVVREALNVAGFYHSAAAADFNGDGKPDVVVTNNFTRPSVQIWLGAGDGTFARDDSYLPPALNVQANHFTVDVPDVDGDGQFDLFVGGHEWENAPTQVFLNPGAGNFAAAQPVTLPAVANEGVVLDVVVTGTAGARVLWVMRTSGGDGTFYQSLTLQRVDWASLASTVPILQRGTQWQPWIIPAQVGGQGRIVSDDISVTTISVPY